MQIRRFILVVLHTAVFFALTGFSQNLFKNPSFEEPAISTEIDYLNPPGWIVTGAPYAEIQRNFGGVKAAHGQQWLELDVASNSTISQDVPTVIGQRYRIQPWYANRLNSPSSTIEIQIDGVGLGTVVTTGTTFITAYGEFVATKSVHRIGFAAKGPADSVGDYLDNVVMMPVDAPASSLGYRYYIPHIATGDTWSTTVNITNAGNFGYTAANSFFIEEISDTGLVSTLSSGALGLNLSRTVGFSASPLLRVGWVQVRSGSPLNVSAIFKQSGVGRPDFEAGVAGREPTTEVFAPFDNTGPYTTGAALANPNSFAIVLNMTVRDESGITLQTRTITLNAKNHISFLLPEQLPGSLGRKGSIEIQGSTSSGSPATFVPLGLRLTSGGAFASLPW
jgi:hypothetical protein